MNEKIKTKIPRTGSCGSRSEVICARSQVAHGAVDRAHEKYKKIVALIISSLLVSLFVSVPVASAGEVCADINDGMPSWAQLDCGDSGDTVSFIGFEGGLSAPTEEGLDDTLTRAKTAREFIRNTLNFALSFLGIIALVIVIYGGFLYVTAAGNEEQSGKGKKAITYAAIGILIIIASFGLVNTLITSVGGEGAGGGGRGAAESNIGDETGSNIGQQSIYNLAAQALNGSLNDFVGAYKNLVTMDGLLKKIESIPKPNDDPRESENRRYLSAITEVISEIKNSTNSLSQTHIAARKLLDGDLAIWANADLSNEEYENGALKGKFTTALGSLNLKTAYKGDFTNVIEGLIGGKGKLSIVKTVLGEIVDAPVLAITNKRGLLSEKDIERAFAGIDQNTTAKEIFKEVDDSLKSAKELISDATDSAKVVRVIRALDLLHTIVKNIEFVFVKIKATVREGNAPLVVELNGLDSRDPAGATIVDARYEWDAVGTEPNFADIFVVAAKNSDTHLKKDVECKPGNTGPAITCTYNQPGTYIVRLKISSQDPSQVATGQAFLPIKVMPSVARIALSAKVGPITEDLRKYEQDSSGKWSLSLDKHELQVTSDEARGEGVEFNSSQSKGGGGAEISTYNWTFGDGSGNFDKTGPVIKHPYKNKGKYQLKLEVTDTGNRKDRVMVNVSVGSLAARILAPSEETEPDALVEFDGSTSHSDKGPISSYEWKIFEVKEDGETEVKKEQISLVGDTASPSLRVRFKKSGSYKVTLTVNDGSEPKSDEAVIFVKSRKPRANFFMRACPDDCPDRFKPNVVALDASPSFDPDKDELLYAWTIIDEQGNELTKDQSFEVLDGKTLQDKVISLRFFKPGKYKIQLGATDRLDQRLQQTDLRIKEVTIVSTVELKWDDMPISAKLEGGSEGESPKAHFTFKGKVSNADKLVIDFGDNNADEQSLTSGKDVPFEFSHDYTEAKPFLVSLQATSDEGNGENIIPMRVYVQGAGAPLAVIEASVDNAPIILTDPARDAFEVIRRKTIKFSAENSLNSKGKPSGKIQTLKFSWDFGDGSKNTDQNTQHSYENISPETGPYKVILTVADKGEPTKTNQSTFLVNVVSKKPQVNTISIEKTTAGNATPVDIKVTAEGAMDPDGEIQSYQFWYYDPADKDRQLSPVITYGKENNFANLTVETNGEEGTEHEYVFCVSVTDKENTTSECHELFQDEELPTIHVVNGPNNPPTADFSIDKNQVKLNEVVTFTANATDPDGTIAQYFWDFDGNGFQDDQPTDQATVTHTYTRQSRGSGYQVKLKVVDDKGAAGFSKALPVVVSANSNPPRATFTCQVAQDNPHKVTCYDQSTADSANNAQLIKWSWDFDTGKQYGCDGAQPDKPSYCNESKTDDIDSTDQNPTFTYPQGESGRKQVQLTIEDSDGNTAEEKIFVELRPGSVAVTEDAARPNADILNAVFSASGTRPGVQSKEVQINGCTPAGSSGCKRKVIRIPVTGTGTPVSGENVSFFYGQSTGNIKEYKIDKNIWCDSDFDGERTNDWDNKDNISHGCEVAATGEPAENCWTTEYKRRARTPGSPEGPGHFMARLRVEDASDPTNKYSNEDIEVIFDGVTRPDEVFPNNYDCDGNPPPATGSGSLFTKLGKQNTILLSLLAGVIVILIGSGAASYFKRGKRRTH